jgi:hypothetical protein
MKIQTDITPKEQENITLQNILEMLNLINKIDKNISINQQNTDENIIEPTVNTNTNTNTNMNMNTNLDVVNNILNVNCNKAIMESTTDSSLVNNSNTVVSNTCYKEYEYSTIEHRYICIKKEHFDVSMIYLNYTNMKKRSNIEIIYKSPSIFLDGLFFKTPMIESSQISIYTKDKPPYSSVINVKLNPQDNRDFINMLKSVDTYISNYIARHAKDINREMNEDSNSNVDTYLKYENILKTRCIKIDNKFTGNIWINRTKQNLEYEISFKSYLDRKTLDDLKKSTSSKKYIITFNISNIYFNKNNLIPLIKCNRCNEVIH